MKTITWFKQFGTVFLIALLIGTAVLPAAPALAQTTQDLQTQIATLLAQIASLQSQLGTGATAGNPIGIPATFRFTRNLTAGSRGADVRYLQMLLNSDVSTRVNSSESPGGRGWETGYFGGLTRAAVVKFQNKYRAEVLAPVGLINGTGFVGPSTRAKLNALITVLTTPPFTTPPVTTPPVTTPPVTPPPAQVTSMLTVTAGTQPSTTLLPAGALRVPMLRLNLFASGPSTVTLSSFTVQLGSVVQTGAIDGIVLLDENGMQIGQSRVVGSSRSVVFTEPIAIAPGQTRAITVGVNMNTGLSSYQGQTAQLSLVDIRSNAAQTVTTYPISGPIGTVNSTLSIGTGTVQVGGLGTTAASRDIGTVGYTFSSFRVTAGSQEDIILRSIRWIQNGSAGAGDLETMVTVVDGTAYPTTVQGRHFVTNFGAGLRIQQGLSKEVSIRGDVKSGVGRTIAFDIDEESDINIVGATFGFGINLTPNTTSTASAATAEFTTGMPFFSSATVTITGAAVNVSRASGVPAQNIGTNVANQPFGGFDIEVFGEAVSVSSMQFTFTINRASGSSAVVTDMRNVTLVGQSGTVLAGPNDVSGSGTSGTVTFGNVFLPTGRGTYMLRGTLGSTFQEGDIVTASLVPSTALSGIRGQTSGTAVSAAPTSTVSGHQMTVRSASIRVTTSSTPVAQTIVAGAQNFVFANIQLDATASSEDIRFTTIPVRFTHSASATSINDCQLWNGATAHNVGSNIVNPTASHTSGTDLSFTLDTPLVVPKGTVATLTLRCDVSSSAAVGSTWSFGVVTAPTGTGVQSGQAVAVSVTPSTGQTMTVATAGTFTVTKSFNSPSYRIVASGSMADIAAFTVRAGTEAINLDQIGFQLTGTTASSSSNDISSLVLIDGTGSQVGTVTFTGGNRTATSTLTSNFTVPANGERELTVRAAFAQVGSNLPGTQGAFIKIDYDGNNASSTRAVGQASGSTVFSASTADTDTEGVRLMRSIPSVNAVGLPTGTLVSGENVVMRYSVMADANGSVGFDKFTVSFSTSTGVSLTDVTISAFTDSSFSSPASGNIFGRLDPTPAQPNGSGVVEVYARTASGTQAPFQVPGGVIRYFEVRGTVTGASTGSSVQTRLLGDSAYPSLASLMGTEAAVDADANDNLIWSPNRNGQSALADTDWTNGYGVRNLPATGLTQTLSR